jgi:hypothetical protein
VPLGFADRVYFSDGLADGAVATPPASIIYNPNPQVSEYSSGNFNLYTAARKQWFNSSDATQPGIESLATLTLPINVSGFCGAALIFSKCRAVDLVCHR